MFRAALYAAEKSESINFNHLERAALLEYREAGRIVFGNKTEESKTTIIRS